MKSIVFTALSAMAVIIGSLIPHNAYGSHIGQGCEVLVDLAIQTCVSDFLAVDGICILYDLDLLGGYFADDTDTQSGTGERLTEYQVLRDTKLQSYLTDLILEQVAQRLDDLLEIYIVGQTPTLWWDLITADSPPSPLSTTSG